MEMRGQLWKKNGKNRSAFFSIKQIVRMKLSRQPALRSPARSVAGSPARIALHADATAITMDLDSPSCTWDFCMSITAPLTVPPSGPPPGPLWPLSVEQYHQ